MTANTSNSCDSCTFAEIIGDTQNCALNLLDKVKEKFDTFLIADGFYNFTGTCPGYRNKKWAENRAGKNLVECLEKETEIMPAIFIPLLDSNDLDSFIDNYKEQIKVAPLVNIINYSDLTNAYILNKVVSKNTIVTTPIGNINPEELIYQNIRLPQKYYFYQMLLIDNAKIPPIDNLYDKIYKKINKDLETVVAVAGGGNCFLYLTLFYFCLRTNNPTIKYITENVDHKFILSDNEL